MDPFASYAALDNPTTFWAELDDILDTPFHPPPPPPSHDTKSSYDAALLDAKRIYVASVLAKFLHLCAASFSDNLASEHTQDFCINRLFASTAFRDDVVPETGAIPMHQLAAEEAIRIMQTSTSIPVLLMSYEIVLLYGDAFPATYKSIQASASTVSFVGVRAFLHRLVHQIWAGSYAAQAEAKIGISQHAATGWNGAHWDEDYQPAPPAAAASTAPPSGSASKDIAIQISLRQKAVRMLYEVCRVQKLEPGHLKAFDERFIHHLFDLVEETRHHHDEDFNYRLIKLLVAMNEQYMVSTLASAPASGAALAGGADQINSAPPTTRPVNLVLSVLQQRLNASKTFGENLIFMLNRASSSDAEDVCMQLLVLKLLYLLFTTRETACYFYTNDLRVLVDIFIRELHDLPDESESLRHTYLRVLHPLLTNTQLCTYAYKRPQIRRLLNGLLAHAHLRDISTTTRRLVERCLRAEWCVELDRLDGTSVAMVEPVGGGDVHAKKMHAGVTSEGLPMLATKIENNTQVRATADSLAVTTEDEVASPVSITTTYSPDAAPASADRPRTSGSLSVPPPLRTRDKRVASLSSPRPCDDGAALLRTNSAAPASSSSGNAGRRAVSAQSAPCTPPRTDSPSLGARQNSRLSELSTDDDALSTSSSWHAHMTEETHTHEASDSTAPKRRKPPQPPSARRLQLSSSEVYSAPSSRADSPCAASPASEDAGEPLAPKAGARRRPPPPAAAAAAAAAAAVVPTVTADDELETAQSFYIAERLRRGLRIR